MNQDVLGECSLGGGGTWWDVVGRGRCAQVGEHMPRGGDCKGHVAQESSMPSRTQEEGCAARAQQPRGTVVLAGGGGFGQGSDHAETWGT